jgi:predicted DsbA family dithiol-disulfide isomerase
MPALSVQPLRSLARAHFGLEQIMALRIDVISDVVCPWCFIGKRRLDRALQLLGQDQDAEPVEAEVVWRPFQLNPQLPREGVARSAYVAAKFGGRSEEVYARVAAAGRSAGIDFAFDRIVRQPNTVAAHQLIDLARESGAQDRMVEALFRGYFLEGKDLTQPAALIELAQQAGIDVQRARLCLDDDAQRQAVVEQDEEAREMGIAGVPFFIFGGQLAVSGAQEPEVLARAFKQAAAELVP